MFSLSEEETGTQLEVRKQEDVCARTLDLETKTMPAVTVAS